MVVHRQFHVMKTPERNIPPEHSRSLTVESSIESLDGEPGRIRVELGPDGMPKAAAFFDVDGTLADLRFVHFAAFREMYPKANPAELMADCEAGWQLRNAYLEQLRIHGIYAEGRSEWKDPEIFSRHHVQEKRTAIGSPGRPEHEQADYLLQQYSEIASSTVEKTYREHPEKFDQAKIQPVVRLAQLYSRLGIPMGVMTGNPSRLSRAFARVLGFSELFIDVASIEETEGKGKERAIEHLVSCMEEKGVPVPKERLILIGDSLHSDIGVAKKLPVDWRAKAKGLLILENQEALEQLQQQASSNPEITQLISDLDVSGLVIEQVPLNDRGVPMLSSKHRRKFLHQL